MDTYGHLFEGRDRDSAAKMEKTACTEKQTARSPDPCASEEGFLNTVMNAIPQEIRTAIGRLIQIAQGATGQSRRVANFLLAWWNAEECGRFDLTELWGVDASIARIW